MTQPERPSNASPPAVPGSLRVAQRTAGALGRVLARLLAAPGPARWP